MNLNEGYFIITTEDLIFEVKGNLHPKNRTIAYLRYAIEKNGERESGTEIRYKKIYPLSERETYLKKYYPKYIWYDPNRKRTFQSINDKDIKIVIDPVDFLSSLRDRGSHILLLQEQALELADTLSKCASIDISCFGITGSLLLGLEKETSDIDLVVYGEDESFKLYSYLQQHFDDIDGISRYSGNLLEKHAIFRWGPEKGLMKEYQAIEARKNLQGLFRDYEFFIRLTKPYCSNSPQYEDYKIIDKGKIMLTAYVLDDIHRIFTPCEYYVKCEENRYLKKIISYRGRFTEQVSKGDTIVVCGRLEEVSVKSQNLFYHQIVVGDCDDILLEFSDYERVKGT